jgi:galactokinase/mevalonate kinase-like predicted kinase
MQSASASLNVPASAGLGASSPDLSSLLNVTIQVEGVTSSSLNLEASLDGAAWVVIKTGLANGLSTLASLIAAGATVMFLRVQTVTIGGGETPAVIVLGQDSRSDH